MGRLLAATASLTLLAAGSAGNVRDTDQGMLDALSVFLPRLDEPANLQTAKDRVVAYYEGGHYDKDMTAVTQKAMQALTDLGERRSLNRSLIVFDVDDTTLSTYNDTKAQGFGYYAAVNHDWILNASAPAIPQSLQLFNHALSLGVTPVFLTARLADERAATAKNLERVGYAKYLDILTWDASFAGASAQQFKTTKRAQLAQQGWFIAMCVGDQESDVAGDYTGVKVKLPNPMYEVA